MPKGATILCAREQGNDVCVWAEVDPWQTMKELRYFDIYGTGHDISDEGVPPRKYIGTAHLMNGRLIFHVFERVPVSRATGFN